MKFTKPAIVTSALFASVAASATGIDKAMTIQSQTDSASVATQQRIDESDERIRQLRQEIEQLKRQNSDLEVYQRHLNALIKSQADEVASLNEQLSNVAQTKQGLVPLMYHMIDGLKRFNDESMPIKQQQRITRIENLEALMAQSNVSEAEKFRLVLEAYLIEFEYGNKLGVYQDQIEIEGTLRDVQVLHLGRLALIARSEKNGLYWLWDQNNNQWLAYDSSHTQSLNRAYEVASQRIAPELITLPIQIQATGK
ncbi:DUF3450 domain-containing protein [Vibrio sinaloensis]|uniref:DUF3450 domain-containing protein n=1 Tax=Photobacterium sp. (strain ATCC 43367) TaxID=379097 RepID=UPI0035E76E86